jgi:hypothetical protein
MYCVIAFTFSSSVNCAPAARIRNLLRKSSKSSGQPSNSCGTSFDPKTGIAASPVYTTMCRIGACAIAVVAIVGTGISVALGLNVFGQFAIDGISVIGADEVTGVSDLCSNDGSGKM